MGCNAVLFADSYLDSGHILEEMCKVNYYFESCYFVNSCYTVIKITPTSSIFTKALPMLYANLL